MAPLHLSRVMATIACMAFANGFSCARTRYFSRSFNFRAAPVDDSSDRSSDEEVRPPPATLPPHVSKLYTMSPSELRAKVYGGMDEATRLRQSGREISSDASVEEASEAVEAARDFVMGVTPEDPDGLFKLHGALRSMDQLQPKSLGVSADKTSQEDDSSGDDKEDLWGEEVALFRARAAEAQAMREASGLAEAAKAAKVAKTTPLEAKAAQFFAGYSNEELSGLWSVHSGVVRPAEIERAPPKVEDLDNDEPADDDK